MEPIPRDIQLYVTKNEQCPFTEWLESLKDIKGRAVIRQRINRVRLGNVGLNRSLGDGVWELKVTFGPGYRVYYGVSGPTIVILLCGGDKGSQSKDIEQAKKYWRDFLG